MNEKLVTFVKNYWSYYLRLESKFLETLNYVEFDKDNFSTFSFEYLNLLLSVCSEIDVVGKVIAYEKNPSLKEKPNIYEWWDVIKDEFVSDGTNITEKEVLFFRKQNLTPWKGFYPDKSSKEETPFWWKAYNDVKHNRSKKLDKTDLTNYKAANLENVANAFAGLYILEHSFIKSITDVKDLELIHRSKLFEIEKKSLKHVNEDEERVIFEDKEMI